MTNSGYSNPKTNCEFKGQPVCKNNSTHMTLRVSSNPVEGRTQI